MNENGLSIGRRMGYNYNEQATQSVLKRERYFKAVLQQESTYTGDRK